MAIVIHRATIEEAPLVHRIMIEAFAEYAKTLQAPSGAMTETVADVAESMARGGAILAWDGPQAVGSARFEPRDGFLYVGRVAVLPAHRRRGIARAMMSFMETEAEAAGFQRIELGVRMSLPSNLALYASLGYETVAITPHRSGLDNVVWLAKDLSGPLETWQGECARRSRRSQRCARTVGRGPSSSWIAAGSPE